MSKKNSDEVEGLYKRIITYLIAIWAVALVIVILQTWNWWDSSPGASDDQIQTSSKVSANSDVLLLQDGDYFTLDLTSNEYSPLIDGTEVCVDIRLKTDRVYKYADGSTDTVRQGEFLKDFKINMYRVKPLHGSYTAVIKGYNPPCN